LPHKNVAAPQHCSIFEGSNLTNRLFSAHDQCNILHPLRELLF
jgi:hypothetical protein